MTDDELDSFFLQTLTKTLDYLKECRSYVEKYKWTNINEVLEDYDILISDLTEILPSINSIDDLAQMNGDLITNIYDSLDAYAESFVISQDSDQQKNDLQEYAKIEEILNLFMDEDEEE
ncbi:MAG: hypothetical protein K5839_04020 [Treponemataceae bacterium]|nr:hypothetical protein [Treponemataceae bacterium]